MPPNAIGSSIFNKSQTGVRIIRPSNSASSLVPDVELVAIQDSDADLVARRAAEVGSPPTLPDYPKMLATTRPHFAVALGRHRQMAGIAHDLLDQGYPFLMEKPMGINAPEVEAVGGALSPIGTAQARGRPPPRLILKGGCLFGGRFSGARPLVGAAIGIGAGK